MGLDMGYNVYTVVFCAASHRQGAAQVSVHQEGQEELVSDRSDRPVQEVEVAEGRGIGNRIGELGLVSLLTRLIYAINKLNHLLYKQAARNQIRSNCKIPLTPAVLSTICTIVNAILFRNARSEESKQDGDLDDWIMTVKGQHFGQHFSSKKHATAADVAAASALADEQQSMLPPMPPPTSLSMPKQHNGGAAGGLLLLQTTTTTSASSVAAMVGSGPASPVTTPTTPTSTNSNGPLGMAMQRDANLNHYKVGQ